MEVDSEQFKKRSSYLYFRTRLIERWTLLNQHHTYPNMLMPLKIGTGIPSGHQ